MDRKTVGYNYKGLYKNGVAQIPSFGGSRLDESGSRAGLQPRRLRSGRRTSGLYANKYMPSFSDTVTKVWGKHTVKGGFFWEWIRNAQPANNNTNGQLQVRNGNSNYASATTMPTW